MNTQISKIRWVSGSILLGGAFIIAVVGITSIAQESWSSDDDHQWYDHNEHVTSALKPYFNSDAVYIEECGACHFAYPPGLLPAQSWHAMMNGLGEHFGENAELETQVRIHIARYLEQNALQKSTRGNMGKMRRNLPDGAPLRITELPYFIHEHDEIPRQLISDNPKVDSLSQCDSCHKEAARGLFDEDRIIIPGYGPWDD